MIKLRDMMDDLPSENEALQLKVKALEKALETEFPQIDMLDLYIKSNGALFISHIRIKKEFRGRGIGSEIIHRIKKFADEHKLTISLSPEAEPRYKAKLDRFYKSHGFVHNTGRNKDYRLSVLFGKEMHRRPGINEDSEPIESDTWDDWYEYIRYHDYDLPKEELTKLVQRFGLKGEKYFGGKILKIWDSKTTVWLEYDQENGTADFIKDITQWIYDLSDSDFYRLGVEEDKMYNGHVDSTLSDLRKEPCKVYHYTTDDDPDEGWNAIQQDGKIVGSYGSGINNRGAYGIFTSVDPQEYALGTYGNVCLEIDLPRFKADAGLAELNLDFEPQVNDYLVRSYVVSVLELDNEVNIEDDGGISPYTVIVNHVIPVQYLKNIS
jgi:predicted GNAT family acetyltransferase